MRSVRKPGAERPDHDARQIEKLDNALAALRQYGFKTA